MILQLVLNECFKIIKGGKCSLGFIYKVTNRINGKIYIGQTSQTIKRRWNQHIYESNKTIEPYRSALHRAIKKYGVDAFDIVEVEECNNDMLNEREIFWINYYNSYHNGYNLDLGGNGSRRCDDKKLMELWNKGYSVVEIIDVLHLDRSTISNHLKRNGISQDDIVNRGKKIGGIKKRQPIYYYDIDGNYVGEFSSLQDAEMAFGIKIYTHAKYKLYGGYQWKRIKVDKIDSIRKFHEKNVDNEYINPFDNSDEIANNLHRDELEITIFKKEVHQYDMNGQYIQSFDSITEAANLTHGIRSSIRDVCNGKTLQSHGYQWRYEKFDNIEPLDFNKIRKNKPVYQYSINGQYIQSFESSQEAARILQCNARSIRKACSGILKQTNGYQWRYEKYDNIESVDGKARSSKAKEVYQYSLDGKYIQSFDSVKEASALFGDTKLTKIPKVCRQEVNQAYGFLWRYYKVENL